jgi:flagellar protein FliS
MSVYADAQNAYTTSSILTAPPERLVVMLYDSAIRFVSQAAAAVEAGDLRLATQRVQRVDAILDELNLSLDMSHGELPERLRSIYLFCKRHLVESLLRKDPEGLRVVSGLLAELRDAWEQIAGGSGAEAAAS